MNEQDKKNFLEVLIQVLKNQPPPIECFISNKKEIYIIGKHINLHLCHKIWLN